MIKFLRTMFPAVRLDARGVTLLETVIATAVIAIGFVAFVSGFKSISRSVSISRARTLASNFIQEKIEKVKSMNYYRVVVTVDTAFDTSVSPSIPFDNTYFPPEDIVTSGIRFRRYTYIQNVQEVNGSVTPVAPDSDTGMKMITVTVTWMEDGKKKKMSMQNIVSNPDIMSTNSMFTGTVRDANTLQPIPGAKIVVAENLVWEDLADSNGRYGIRTIQGTYYLIASAHGYFNSTALATVGAGQTLTQDFGLVPMSSGTVRGVVWLQDHPVISQVVASTVTASGIDQEFIELYNPTTSYFPISSDMFTSVVQTYYQGEDAGAPSSIVLTYPGGAVGIPPHGYFLIANTNTVTACGVTRTADAVYFTPGSDVIRSPDAGGVGIKDVATGAWVDRAGWDRNLGAKYAALYEGNSIDQNAGFTQGEQYVRRTSTGGYTAGYGRVYDSGDNNTDFIDNVTMAYPPRNSTDIEVPLAGTPALGAIVSSNDGLSGPVTAVATGSPAWAEFNLVSVATGTWNVLIASSTYFQSISTVTVNANATTWAPNAATSPSWPFAGYPHSYLSGQSDQGFISGRVVNVWGQPIAGMKVSVGGTKYPTSSQGYYFVNIDTGTYQVTANPDNENVSYVTQSAPVDVALGQISSGVDFTLSQGGMLRGFVTRDGVNPLPNVAIIAMDASGFDRGHDISDSAGKFTLVNLDTGTYTVQPVLGSKEKSSPLSLTATVNVGTNVHIGTFTVSGTMGTITGSVTQGGRPIMTGVLIVASTSTIGAVPPAISSATLTLNAIYATSSQEDGTYFLDVRGSTSTAYSVYAWYPVVSGTTVIYSSRTLSGVSVNSGQTRSGVNLSW